MKNSNSNAGREVEPADSWNESKTLVTMLIQSESLGNGEILCVYLGGTRIHADDTNCPGNGADASSYQADRSRSQADRSRAWTDTLNMSNSAETAVISHGESVSTYLGVRDMKHAVLEMDGIGCHADASTGLLMQMVKPYVDNSNWDACVCLGGTQMQPGDVNGPFGLSCKTGVSSSQVDALRGQPDASNVLNRAETNIISHGKGVSTYLGIGDAKRLVNETDGTGIHADTPTGQMQALSIETEGIKSANETENIRKCQTESEMQNSPSTPEIAMAKPTYRWKWVSPGDRDVYTLAHASEDARLNICIRRG